MPNGNAVVNFTVATSEQWKDQHGQQKERIEWHQLVAYGKLAEVVGEYLRKGSKGYFEGKLKTSKWTDQQGLDRYKTEVVIEEMQMLGSKPNPRRHSSMNANNPNASELQSYVMSHLHLTQAQAIVWLDCNAPRWRIAKTLATDERVHFESKGEEWD